MLLLIVHATREHYTTCECDIAINLYCSHSTAKILPAKCIFKVHPPKINPTKILRYTVYICQSMTSILNCKYDGLRPSVIWQMNVQFNHLHSCVTRKFRATVEHVYYGHLGTNQRCPDYQGVQIIKVS